MEIGAYAGEILLPSGEEGDGHIAVLGVGEDSGYSRALPRCKLHIVDSSSDQTKLHLDAIKSHIEQLNERNPTHGIWTSANNDCEAGWRHF